MTTSDEIAPREDRTGARPRILVVDDVEENRILLTTLLEGNGYQVACAPNGAVALSMARGSRPDLIISDVLMPTMDGYELCRQCKLDGTLRQIPIVIYTATYTSPKDERLALSLGAQCFLVKPLPSALLLEALRDVCRISATTQTARAPAAEVELLRLHNETLAEKLSKKVVELEGEIARRDQLEAARAEARREADEAHARLDALVANTPDTLLVVDRNDNIEFINQLFPHFTREQIIGSSWLSFVPAEKRQAMTATLRRVFESGETANFESTTPGPDGAPIWFDSHIGPVRQAGMITGAVIVVRDVTEKKRSEAQLISADRMASVGILAAGVAHEINNPLTAVMANLGLALADVTELTEKHGLSRDLLEEVRDARDCAARIRTIVRDLRIFSRAEAQKHEPVDTRRVIESTLRMVRNEIRHRARLVENYGDVPPVDADESRLGQVFLNIIVNAAHAIPEGRAGTNEIRVSTVLDATSGEVVVAITDTGSGMSPEVRKQLFTPFFTTKPAGEGTGLGLTICRRIVEDLGGRIEVESELGKGTTFRIHLRKAPAGLPSAAPPAAILSAPRRGRILVIDDEPLVGAVVRRSLAAEHEVICTTRSREVLDRVSAGERFDVILCDLMMPDVTGMDVYDDLVRSSPSQAERMVFMTGGAFTPRARTFLERVPNPRFEKPFESSEIRSLVNELIR